MARPFHFTAGGAELVQVRLESARLQYRETGEPIEGFPSVATMRERAANDAARVMQPFTPHLIFAAAAIFIAALTLGFIAAAEAERAIILAERV